VVSILLPFTLIHCICLLSHSGPVPFPAYPWLISLFHRAF
jgi:hypothetical protein